MLHHIALTVNDFEEIENFYEDVLLLTIHHQFSVSEEISRGLFNIMASADVYMMERQDVRFEIFISEKREKRAFSHVCLVYREAKQVYKKAVEIGYQVRVKQNPKGETYFIRDKSGNMFEIKELIES